MTQRVLVVNSGSSSLKYGLVEPSTGETLAGGLVERIGDERARLRHDGPSGRTERTQPVTDHPGAVAAVLALFDEVGPGLQDAGLVAVGHRVVQGGDRYTEPVLVDDDVEAGIAALSPLAPLHNPANLAGIAAARAAFPDLPHVAVFDTAFHSTLPPEAYTYAIDAALAREHGIRRYGFHGTSHAYVARRTAELLGKRPTEVDVIVAHLGNGASITAVRRGVSVETSMGLTPLEGLVMGTRSGDIDPAVITHLHRVAGMSVEDVDILLNRRSGMLGLAGSNDLRDVHRAAAGQGPDAERARLALDVYCHRLKHYVGAYYALLGGADAVAFTAGVGENDAAVRARSLAGLERLGIAVDPARNGAANPTVISPEGAEVTVLVVATNEELEIARQTVGLLGV